MNCGGGAKEGQAGGRCLSVSCLNTRCCWPAVNWITTHEHHKEARSSYSVSVWSELHSPGTAR